MFSQFDSSMPDGCAIFQSERQSHYVILNEVKDHTVPNISEPQTIEHVRPDRMLYVFAAQTAFSMTPPPLRLRERQTSGCG
jgi:hypothetical protein